MSRPSQSRSANIASVWFVVCNGLQAGVGFVALPFLTRIMSPDQYGLVTVYNAWLALVTVFASLNLYSGAFNNAMAMYPRDRSKYTAAMVGVLVVLPVGVFSVLLLARAAGLSLSGLPLTMLAVMFVQIVVNNMALLYTARQRYELDYRPLVLFTVVSSLGVTAFSVGLVAIWPDRGSTAQVRVWSSALATALVVVPLAVRKLVGANAVVNRRYWRFAVLFSLPLIAHYIALMILGQADRILIGQTLGKRQAAIYSVAYMLGNALGIIASALNSALVPWQFERLRLQSYAGLGRRVGTMLALVSAGGIALSLVAPELLQLAAPPEYQSAAPVVSMVAGSVIFVFLYNSLSNYEFFFMANRFIAIASAAAAILNVALNCWLIPIFGIFASGAATVVSYLALAAAHSVFSRRVCRRILGTRDAAELFNPARAWIVAIVACVVALAVIPIYPMPFVRYALLLGGLGLAALFWRKILASLDRV